MDTDKELDADDLVDNDGIDDVDIELEDVGTPLNVEDYKEKAEDPSEKDAEIVIAQDESEEGVLEDEEDLSDKDRELLGKRAQRRISQLIKRSKTAEERVADLEKKFETAVTTLGDSYNLNNSRERELLVEHDERIKAQESEAIVALKAAKEDGDIDQEIVVQDNLMQLKAEKMLVERAKAHFAQQDREAELAAPGEEGGRAVRPQSRAPARRPVAVDRNALRWQKRNTWFGGKTAKEELMTTMAYTVHNELLSEGYYPDPKDADAINDYYSALDSRIKVEFPEEFEAEEQEEGESTVSVKTRRKPTQVVAGGTRTSGKTKGKFKVSLTKSEILRAKSLGVSPEAYAREKAKIARSRA